MRHCTQLDGHWKPGLHRQEGGEELKDSLFEHMCELKQCPAGSAVRAGASGLGWIARLPHSEQSLLVKQAVNFSCLEVLCRSALVEQLVFGRTTLFSSPSKDSQLIQVNCLGQIQCLHVPK